MGTWDRSHIPRGSTHYSSNPGRSRNKFLYYVMGFFSGIFRMLVLKFGPSGSEVDVKDDSLDRWYVNHKRFDSERNEVRNVFLKAFSNQKGQMKYFTEVSEPLEARKLAGEVPRYEHIMGGRYAPGYHAQIRENRRQNRGAGGNFVRFERMEGDTGKTERGG